MPASPVHSVTDPATGDTVSLRILARRHGLKYWTVAKRHRLGKRGWRLVESHREARSRAGTETQERLEELRHRATYSRQAVIERLKAGETVPGCHLDSGKPSLRIS